MNDSEIRENLASVRKRVSQACADAGRQVESVELLLATKSVPADKVAVAVEAGARLIGENRVQELAAKDETLKDLPVTRHFIGHLQSNKVNHVLRYVSGIQSIDNPHIARRLQLRLEALDRQLDVLVQVNTSREDSKFGVPPDDAAELVRTLQSFDHLRVQGFMTIGLNSGDREQVRTSYRELRILRDHVSENVGLRLPVLSMGMSRDLDVAITEGSTMIRVGSAVFGQR